MSLLELLILAAGCIQIGIIAFNVRLPRELEVGENIARLSPLIRQVFLVHWGYILYAVLFFAGLCLAFPSELAGASPLGATLSAFLAVFWLTRVVLQLFYYDASIRRRYPKGHLALTVACLFMGSVFAVSALQVLR